MLMFVLALAPIFPSLHAQEWKDPAQLPAVYASWPAPVRATFEKLAPGATLTKLVKNGHSARWGVEEYYEAYIKPGKNTIEYIIAPDGRLLATVTHLSLADAPAAVKYAIEMKSKAAKSTLPASILHWQIGGDGHYTFPVIMPVVWKVDPEGKLLGKK